MIGSIFQALIVPSAADPSRVPNANTLNDEGVQSWRVGRRSEAVGALTAATRADKTFAVPWHNRGAIYLTEGQFTQAIAELTEAAQLAPQWTLPRSHLAQAYLRTGNATAALDVSDAARALDPTLPDIRNDLRGLLQARLRVASEVAVRRRTQLLVTIGIAALVTILTAGLGLGSIALPIYRFYLFSQASRTRDRTRIQLRALEGAPDLRASGTGLPAPRAATSARPGPKPIVPYLVAGTLPPYSTEELEPGAVSGAGFRGAGWSLLVLSVLACAIGIYLIILGNASGGKPATFSVTLEDSAFFLMGLVTLGIGAAFAFAAVMVGAVAALRRKRTGWAVCLVLLGGIGVVLLIVPAQVMSLLYLVFMPIGTSSHKLEFVPVPNVSLIQR